MASQHVQRVRTGWLCLGILILGPSPSAAREFIRGDANQDAIVDISDPQFTLNFLFLGGPDPSCLGAADANDDEVLDISDPQFTLNFLFLGGSPPPAPFPGRGFDPTQGLGCGLDAPRFLSCRPSGAAVDLSWQVVDSYDAVEIVRDGEVVASLPGNALSYTDRPARGGTHDYAVHGRTGDILSDRATCRVTGLPDNQPPSLLLQAPAQGTVVASDTILIRGRVNDDRAVTRIVLSGDDVTPEGPPPVPYTFTAEVSLAAGPNLVRCEAVDDFGRATFAELAVGREPILRIEAASEGVALDITGGSGYDEIEVIVRPFLDGVPALVDGAIRGITLYRGSFLGVDLEVKGDRAEVVGSIGLDLFPTDAGGGRVGMRVHIQTIRLLADGETDFGIFGSDSWDATWTANNVTLTGSFAFEPTAGGSKLEVVSDGFTVTIGSSSTRVSGFLDPAGIFDRLVNFLAGIFEDEIEAEVKRAVEEAANNELLPVIRDTFGSLNVNLDLGQIRLDTSYHDVLESPAGLSLLFNATWRGTERDPSFPRHAGSVAQFARFPTFPLRADVGHPVDATICLSEDTLNQALLELVAGGLLQSELDFGDVESPLPLVVGTFAEVLDPRLLGLPGVSWDNPLGLRLRAKMGPTVRLGEGVVGEPLIAHGATWRYAAGRTEPPSNWKDPGFRDGGWLEGESGFGYSSDPTELLAVSTELEDMATGAYTSLYIRSSFEVDDPGSLRGLVLQVLYDDAFVAYLNGEEVARRNVEGTPGTPPLHDAVAGGAIEPTRVEVDLSPFLGRLRAGTNLLAIQGHNAGPSSSDFVLAPELIAVGPRPAGVVDSLPTKVVVNGLEVTFLADADADGVGESDGDGVADEVALFGFSVGFTLQTELLLLRDETGAPLLAFTFQSTDGPDPDSYPDAIVGGVAGFDVEVAMEAFDSDDGRLLEFAQLMLALLGPFLGDALLGFELPTFPLPQLEFDLDGDGTPNVRLEITNATFVPVDTNGGSADWVCVLSNLRAANR